jgi:hypothetical protein
LLFYVFVTVHLAQANLSSLTWEKHLDQVIAFCTQDDLLLVVDQKGASLQHLRINSTGNLVSTDQLTATPDQPAFILFFDSSA